MMSEAARTRQQQEVDELCAAAIRALSGEPRAHFRQRRLHCGPTPVAARAPHLQPSLEDDDFDSFRGVADGLALRLSLSDADLHRGLAPEGDEAALVFEMLEQFRVEALAPRDKPGIARNLRHRHETWSHSFHASGLTDTARGYLLYAVAQICRSRVTRQRVWAETEDFIEEARFILAPLLGHELAQLGRTRSDQAAYAAHARAIAEKVAGMLRASSEEQEGDETRRNQRNGFSIWLESWDEQESTDPAPAGQRRAVTDSEHGYRVFTGAYDREDAARALVPPALLEEYRRLLDDRVAEQKLNVSRFARELRGLLAEPARDGWEGQQEAGLVDGRTLVQLIASPTERRLFRTERYEPVTNCMVTFLVDCSASMRQYRQSLATIVDVFARALDLAGVSSELLGFTTGAWNGGRAMREWQRAGRPSGPGRLNERRHLVFKDADTPWRMARRGIAAMLKDDLYREGIDGEAVRWACERMQGRPEEMRLLVVVSDGSPMDSATTLANDEQYLDHHLRFVVADEEAKGTRVHGLGVGLDLSGYYSRSHIVDLDEGVSNRTVREIIDLLADNRPFR
jgi:cobaltochelatase CobT